MSHRDLGIISMRGTLDFCKRVDYYLQQWYDTKESFLINCELTRFSTGDGKATLLESVRGRDIYIISDPYDYSCTYDLRGTKVPITPDEQYQDIKRVISAIDGKASRISVIMTLLYSSRQHARTRRESLDCALILNELAWLGVQNIVTFDAHDPRVQNAIPLTSFDNFYPNYQMIKALTREERHIFTESYPTLIVAPDAGGVQRCLKFAESLNMELGMFYKRR
ncbi:MAG: ribose-phosphate pyrophosphokinase-like domain-containing protein, partial [Clostridiales bacterium]|nr:ribose-phosphate pyrophosphokinase-like domain-containing protein [Clostridiales bacterium]